MDEYRNISYHSSGLGAASGLPPVRLLIYLGYQESSTPVFGVTGPGLTLEDPTGSGRERGCRAF